MIIEFELQGSKALHKGIFDTTGLWIKYEACFEEGLHTEDGIGNPQPTPNGYKLYSHFSFAYYHTEKGIVDKVYERLISILRGSNNVEIENIGYIRKLNK